MPSQFVTLDPLGNVPTIGVTDVITTGSTFFVDSNNGSDTNDGLTPDTPLVTLAAAVALCTANKGDVIYLMPGHSESISTSVSVNKAGVSILGMANSFNKPLFAFDTSTSAEILLPSAGLTIRNVEFQCNVDSQVNMVRIAGANYVTLENCTFTMDAGGTQALIGVNLADATDGHRIRGCRFISTNAGASAAIEIGAATTNLEIFDCYIYGDFSDAGIHNPTGNIATTLDIRNNFVANLQAGDHAIELVSACTGRIADNRLYSNAAGTCLDPGSCSCFNNECNNAIDTGSHELPTTGDDITGVYSDTTVLESDSIIIESQSLVVLSAVSDILSDTTIVSSDTLVIESDTTVIESDTTIIESQSLVILSAVSDILSDTAIIYSDTTIIYSDTTIIYSDTTIIASDLVLTYSDTTAIHSDTTIIASDLLLVYSDTTIIASDLLLTLSDTSDILSQTTKVLSDTTAVHSDTTAIHLLAAAIGGVVGKTGTFADNTLTNNTQVVTLATATGGDVYIEQVIIEKDGTLFAGPTNLELSTDNAYGQTGADAPVAAEATASLGANAVVACTAASVTPMVPFVLESAKKLFAHGSDGAGTSAGNIKYTIVGRRMTAGATLA